MKKMRPLTAHQEECMQLLKDGWVLMYTRGRNYQDAHWISPQAWAVRYTGCICTPKGEMRAINETVTTLNGLRGRGLITQIEPGFSYWPLPVPYYCRTEVYALNPTPAPPLSPKQQYVIDALQAGGRYINDNNPWLLRWQEEGIGRRAEVLHPATVNALLQAGMIEEYQHRCYRLTPAQETSK